MSLLFKNKCRPLLSGAAVTLVFVLQGCQATAPTPAVPSGPEHASGWTDKRLAHTREFMVAAANPLAAQAGVDMIEAGGNAVDAAIAVQLALTLVEPQSSGIGGGAYALLSKPGVGGPQLLAFDGREIAPKLATSALFLDDKGAVLPTLIAGQSGRSVGVPGAVLMMEDMHRSQGRLPWSRLFQPAINLAEKGFPVSARLNLQIKAELPRLKQAEIRRHFLTPAGEPLPVGYLLKNPELAQLLKAIASQGSKAFYQGAVARDIARAVREAPVLPGSMTEADVNAYRMGAAEPVCGPYRAYRICGMTGSTSGGITLLQTLGMLEGFDMRRFGANSLDSTHAIAQAFKLSFADRNRYLGDPASVAIPMRGLLAPQYLRERASLIRMDRDLGIATSGRPPGVQMAWGADQPLVLPSTSHISIVDREGQALSLTTSVGLVFGARLMTHGFVLNDQLVAFSLTPKDTDGQALANAPGSLKRPLSSMAPTLAFDAKGDLFMVTGSPGSSAIIGYTLKTLVGVIDWGLDAQQAINLPNVINRNGPTELEKGSSIEALADGLRARGNQVVINNQTSGLQAIVREAGGWQGGADPRREGLTVGR